MKWLYLCELPDLSERLLTGTMKDPTILSASPDDPDDGRSTPPGRSRNAKGYGVRT
jgi:hypothetical protein